MPHLLIFAADLIASRRPDVRRISTAVIAAATWSWPSSDERRVSPSVPCFRVSVGVGVGLGLFGVFAIVRLRSTPN